jgi:CubicO group peptidase (beta-lactamase class C family)
MTLHLSLSPFYRSLLILGAALSAMAAATLAQESVPVDKPGPLAPALQSLVDRHVVAGAVVLVADEDKVLDLEAAGYSSLGTKAPMKTDALFWIASMTKSLTGTALMMLVDEGKLSLDDPVEKYLPEFKGQMVKEENAAPHPPQHPITIREVMDHTSGLVKANDPVLKRTGSLKENVAQFAALPLLREPGTKFEYNNSGINTGARVVEVIAGMPYAEFVQQRLFTPLDMKETTFWPNEELGKRLASSTKPMADKSGLEDINQGQTITPALIEKLGRGAVVPAPVLANFGLSPLADYANHFAEAAGGLYSTAGDVGRFCQMLLKGGTWQGKRYLSAEALKQMTAVQTGDVMVNPQEGYGVGWFVKKRDDEGPAVGSFGHRGARKTVMWVDPKNRLVTVLMVQCWDISGEQQKELYQTVLKGAVEKFGRQQGGEAAAK